MQAAKLRIASVGTTVLLLLFCVFQPDLVTAQETSGSQRAAIEVIAAQHRDPLFLKTELLSFLDPRGSIGLVDNKLIIASTAGNLQQLKDLIAGIDVPARRLVVSVDFEFGGSRPENANQQSSQALEGDTISFVDVLPDEPEGLLVSSGQASGDPSVEQSAQSRPQLSMTTAIRGELAETEVEIANVPGFSSSYLLSLQLGEWYVINPAPEQDDITDSASSFDNAGEIPSTLPASPSELLPDVAPIAVRVDVLP